jgi:hypothetical protein
VENVSYAHVLRNAIPSARVIIGHSKSPHKAPDFPATDSQGFVPNISFSKHCHNRKGTCEIESGAGDGNRTHVASLEGWSSTIELHPHRELHCNSAVLVVNPLAFGHA